MSSASSSSHQPHPRKELNYMNTEYVKDRNSFATTGRKANGSSGSSAKFNQKNSGATRESGGAAKGRRGGANNNNGGGGATVNGASDTDNGVNRKSHSPSSKRKYFVSGNSGSGSGDNGMRYARQIGSSSPFTSKSIPLQMSWRPDANNQRMVKRQIAYQNIKHKTNRSIDDDADNDDDNDENDENDDNDNDNGKSYDKDNVEVHNSFGGADALNRHNVGHRMNVAGNDGRSADPKLSHASVVANNVAGRELNDKLQTSINRLDGELDNDDDTATTMVNRKKSHGNTINYGWPRVAYLQQQHHQHRLGDNMRAHGNGHDNNGVVDTFDGQPSSVMELECVAGYDGGLPQYFVLEAYDSRTKKLRLNVSSAFSDVPLFRIDLAGRSNDNPWFLPYAV